MDLSIRSGELAEEIVERVFELNPNVDRKAALKNARSIVGKLTKAEAPAKTSGDVDSQTQKAEWDCGDDAEGQVMGHGV